VSSAAPIRGAGSSQDSGALSELEQKITVLEQQLRTERAAVRRAQAESARLAIALRAAASPPLPAQVLAEAKPIRGRRLLTWLTMLALIVGILAVVDAFMTLVFQEPISGFFAAHAQSEATKKLSAEEKQFAAAPSLRGETNAERYARLARLLGARKHAGDQLGRVSIPTIGLSTVMFQGSGAASLRKGAAHYTGTRLPGQPGTVGIAGHRTTFGAPFRHINDLKPGNRIIVRMPYATFTYLVESTKIVSPQTLSVLKSSNQARSVGGGAPTTQKVVLTACHPIGSAAQRIVVTGRLVRSDRTTPA
jgi:sortase A